MYILYTHTHTYTHIIDPSCKYILLKTHTTITNGLYGFITGYSGSTHCIICKMRNKRKKTPIFPGTIKHLQSF